MTSSDKMDLSSMDVAAQKREELKQLLGAAFPEVFSEGSVDFDQLKRVLGTWIEPSKERFGLNWAGKADCMKVIQQASYATLKPNREASVEFDKTKNIFIEGDNLEALKLLQKSYFGKVKLIYIDPPYNTGKEFIYPDKFSETLETYLKYTGQIDDDGKRFSTNSDSIGRYHSNWLNMMYTRLYLAKNLLTDDGIIFVSIDDHEIINLFHLMSELFGEENFVSNISVVSNLKGRSDDTFFATAHNYLIAFQKGAFSPSGVALPEEYESEYKNTDKSGRSYRLQGLRKRGSGARRQDRPNMYYPFYVNVEDSTVSLHRSAVHTEEVLPRLSDGTDGRWRWGAQTAADRLSELCGRTVGPENRWDVFQIDYLETEGSAKRVIPKTVWSEKEFANEAGTLEVKSLFGRRVFDTPKPSALIRKCIEYATGEGDIVMDFFAGSASTAHAVFDQNARDGLQRQFVLVQLPEPVSEETEAFEAGFNNISEVAQERIRLADRKINGDLLGLSGFRSFSLSQSNFLPWNGDAEAFDVTGKQLDLHVDHVAADPDPEAMVYEILLKAGFPLTTQVSAIEIAGKQAFSIEDGVLLICLENEITAELIDALAAENPLQVICLDSGFKGNDQLKANAVQTFKARAQAEESEIVFRTV